MKTSSATGFLGNLPIMTKEESSFLYVQENLYNFQSAF
jgi:hypothetical protein